MMNNEALDDIQSFMRQARSECADSANLLTALTIIEQLLHHIEDLKKERPRGFQIGDGNTQQNTF